jgi:uncharacterized protein (TIGR00645 family)
MVTRLRESRGRVAFSAYLVNDRDRYRIPESAMRRIELIIETIIFQTRWILAPFYLGLAFCLLLLLYHFGVQIFEFVVKIPHASETDVILGILTLIDVVFTANLVLIVVLSGYENLVRGSRLTTTTARTG